MKSCCAWRPLFIGSLFGLSFLNLFVLLPLIWSSITETLPERPIMHTPLSLRLPPYPEAAMQGWRRIRSRSARTDIDWAEGVLRQVWCSSSTAHAADSVGEIAALLENRSHLDRPLATAACIRACQAARLADADGSTNDRLCGDGLCICSGGLSANLDTPVDRDVPAGSYGASFVQPLRSAAAVRQSLSRRLFGAAAARVGMPMLGPHSGVADERLRAVRRFESAHHKWRATLAASALNRSRAFARHFDERCDALPPDRAFKVSLRPPTKLFDQAELTIATLPEFQLCARRAAGDTFTMRAYANDVLLQAPLLLENGQGRYAGSFLVLDPGNYSVDVYWVNSRRARWHPTAGIQPPGSNRWDPTAGTQPPGSNRRDPTAGIQPPGSNRRDPTARVQPPGSNRRDPTAGIQPLRS